MPVWGQGVDALIQLHNIFIIYNKHHSPEKFYNKMCAGDSLIGAVGWRRVVAEEISKITENSGVSL